MFTVLFIVDQFELTFNNFTLKIVRIRRFLHDLHSDGLLSLSLLVLLPLSQRFGLVSSGLHQVFVNDDPVNFKEFRTVR